MEIIETNELSLIKDISSPTSAGKASLKAWGNIISCILWNDVNPKNQDLKSLAQDSFAGFTMFIGFLVFVALVYSGLLMILWWADEKQYETWKKWVIYSIVGLLLVGFAYWIVRLIQFFAKG